MESQDQQTTKIKTSSFYLKTALINIINASRYLDMIIVEMGLTKNGKSFISSQVRKLQSIESDVRGKVSPELAKEIRKGITDNWETLGIQNVNHMMMAMDDNEIVEVENFCVFILERKKKLLDEAEGKQQIEA